MRYAILIIICMLFSACSSVRIVPEQAANGRINVVDNSQTISNKGAEITARVDEAGINSYNLDSFVTSIHISIKNVSNSEIVFSENSFVLVDENNLQYELLSPDRVREMLKKDSYYLMPYPYVGFYYLEDYQKTNFYNRHNSSLPYYYELYPQDIYTRALPMVPVIPGMKIEGLTYFKIDPAAHKNFKLLVFHKDTPKSAPPEYSFPFRVDK
jgi:hypothetical protein